MLAVAVSGATLGLRVSVLWGERDEISFEPGFGAYQTRQMCNWETAFYTPPVLGGAALCWQFSASGV